jgi:hypothetical protein
MAKYRVMLRQPLRHPPGWRKEIPVDGPRASGDANLTGTIGISFHILLLFRGHCAPTLKI